MAETSFSEAVRVLEKISYYLPEFIGRYEKEMETRLQTMSCTVEEISSTSTTINKQILSRTRINIIIHSLLTVFLMVAMIVLTPYLTALRFEEKLEKIQELKYQIAALEENKADVLEQRQKEIESMRITFMKEYQDEYLNNIKFPYFYPNPRFPGTATLLLPKGMAPHKLIDPNQDQNLSEGESKRMSIYLKNNTTFPHLYQVKLHGNNYWYMLLDIPESMNWSQVPPEIKNPKNPETPPPLIGGKLKKIIISNQPHRGGKK